MTYLVVTLVLVLIASIYKIIQLKELVRENENYQGNYFKSKQAELLFYLTKLDGKKRNELLELTDEHYENKNLAKKWYQQINKYVHPDKGGTKEAFIVLKNIYDILVEED